MVYDYLPFVILPLYTVMIKLDNSLLEASADLGATPSRTFMRVTLPLTMPGVVSAITMVLLPSTTSYVISDTLGNGNVTIIGKVIESPLSTMFNWHAGSAIAMVFLVIIFVTMLLTNSFYTRRYFCSSCTVSICPKKSASGRKSGVFRFTRICLKTKTLCAPL